MSPRASDDKPFVKAEDLNREELAAKREADKEARMAEKRQQFADAQKAENDAKQAKVQAGCEMKDKLDAWCFNNVAERKWKDVRALLSSINTVTTWESGYQAADVGQLMMNP